MIKKQNPGRTPCQVNPLILTFIQNKIEIKIAFQVELSLSLFLN